MPTLQSIETGGHYSFNFLTFMAVWKKGFWDSGIGLGFYG